MLTSNQMRDAAVARLYQRFSATILFYLLQKVGSVQDAEDLLLEVFIAAFKDDTNGFSPPQAAGFPTLAVRRRLHPKGPAFFYAHSFQLYCLCNPLAHEQLNSVCRFIGKSFPMVKAITSHRLLYQLIHRVDLAEKPPGVVVMDSRLGRSLQEILVS